MRQIKLTLNKLKINIDNFIFNIFKKPYYDYIEKRKKINYNKYIRDNFITQFGVHPDKIKAKIAKIENIKLGGIYAKNGNPIIKMTDDEYQKFITYQLSQSAIKLNKLKPYIKASLFYEPEITDIHNEAIKDKKSLTLNELIYIEEKKGKEELKQQKIRLDKSYVIKKPIEHIEELDDNICNTTKLFF